MEISLDREKNSAKIRDFPYAVRPLPRVYLPLGVLQKIQCFSNLCSHEINGLGIVEKQDNNFIISDVFILKQIADSEEFAVDDKGLNRYIYDLVSSGRDPSAIKFQWHSHVNLPVFFSTKDKDTIDGYMNDYMISFVINKAGQYLCRIDLYKPFYIALEVPVYITAPAFDPALVATCQKEIMDKVTVKGKKFGIFPARRKEKPGEINGVRGAIFEADKLTFETRPQR